MTNTDGKDVYLTRAYHAAQVLTHALSAFAGHNLLLKDINRIFIYFQLEVFSRPVKIMKFAFLK